MARRLRGFTLIELLVVLSLLGVLMGLSIGFIQRAGKGNLLLQTSNSAASLFASARAQSYGNDRSYVHLLAKPGGATVIRSYRDRQVFHWPCENFEQASELGVLTANNGVKLAEGGIPSREGRHVVFAGGGTVSLGDPPWLRWRDGFSLRCRIFPDEKSSAKMQLFRKGNAIQVSLVRGDEGRLDVEAAIQLDKEDGSIDLYEVRTGQRGRVTRVAEAVQEVLETVPEWKGPVLAGRWYDLRVSYDRNSFAIFVDDGLRAIREFKRSPMRPNADAPFVIGGGYAGGFDSLVIGGIFEDDEDRYELAENVTWVDANGTPMTGSTYVHFANRGLDPRYHSAGVELHFQLDAGEAQAGARRTLQIALSGEVFIKDLGQ